MKISERNTAIHFLYKALTPYDFTISQDKEHSSQEYISKFGLSIVQTWPKIQSLCVQKVRYISIPFYEAYNKASSRLSCVLDAEPIDESGTFIAASDKGGSNTIFYHIKSEGKGSDFQLYGFVLFFGKNPNKEKPTLDVFVQRLTDKSTKDYLAENCNKLHISSLKIFTDIFLLLLFIKYCEIETKVIAGGKRGHHVGQKYVNDTHNDIEILDSTWFTTIIKSEGFRVGGHFRMQPYRPGLYNKHLIWISPFDKDGYTRTAKILNNPVN